MNTEDRRVQRKFNYGKISRRSNLLELHRAYVVPVIYKKLIGLTARTSGLRYSMLLGAKYSNHPKTHQEMVLVLLNP